MLETVSFIVCFAFVYLPISVEYHLTVVNTIEALYFSWENLSTGLKGKSYQEANKHQVNSEEQNAQISNHI